MRAQLRRPFWLIMVVGACLFAAYAAAQSVRLLMNPGAGPETAVYLPVAFYGHVWLGVVSLLAGALQFRSDMRERRPGLHRWSGRVYVVTACATALFGFAIAFDHEGGGPFAAVFAVIATLWIGTTAMGLSEARRHRFEEHREWMIRSYSVAYSTVVFRLYAPFVIPGALELGYSANDGVAASAALAVVTTFTWAEFFVRRTRREIPLRAPVPAAPGSISAPQPN